MASETPELMVTEHDAVTGNTIVRNMTAAEKKQYAIDEQRIANGLWDQIRSGRNALLAASDWTQTADAPVDAKAWAAYRQALRDLPKTIKDPTAEIKWPEPPK
jgi:hypothetical protein